MSVDRLKRDFLSLAQKYKDRYKNEGQNLDDLDTFKRMMDIYFHLDGIGGGGTLQEVTDAGNTTTNDIEVNGIHVNGDFSNYNKNIPDIGVIQTSDARGYGNDYVSEKTLAYCRIGASAFDEEGAVRIKNNIFQTYVGGEWKDVPTGFRFRQDPNGNYEFEHKPTGFQWWIEVSSGNSDLLGLNGLPIVQNYAVSMGPYPVPLEIDGGTF